MTPVFTTQQQRDNFYRIENRTKSDIKQIIQNTIAEINTLKHTATAHYLQTIWNREIKTGTKKMYINFYSECVAALEDATVAEENDDGMLL